MTEREEFAYMQGIRAGLLRTLRQTIQDLRATGASYPEDADQVAVLTVEIGRLTLHEEETRQALFSLVRDLLHDDEGEDALPAENLHLADVVEKYVQKRIDL